MHELPRQKLCEVLASYGRFVIDDRLHRNDLLKELLLESCGNYKPEVQVLITVLEAGVVDDLLNTSTIVPPEILLSRLAKRVHDNLGVDMDYARWGVESWAFALGIYGLGTLTAPVGTMGPSAFVFFSYAHQDKRFRDRLEDHLSNLKYRGLIATWHDREIRAGEEWAQQIDIYLNTAHIILLLISSHFMASEYCYSVEMKRALERHEQRAADVIPILLRPVLHTDAPFANLQMLPTNGKPVVSWGNRDSAFVDIALGIERVVQKRLERLTSAPPTGVQFPVPSSDFPLFLVPAPSPPSPPALSSSTAPSPPSPPALSRSRGGCLILVGLAFLFFGLLSAGVLLVQHPNFIPFVGVIVGSLILLAGILLAIRALVKRAQSRAARRQEREEARRRELQEARRQEREEARRRELQEARRREQERAYYEKALTAYEQALRQNNTDTTAYRGKGNALVGLERYDEALTAFEQALVLIPLPTTYVSVGNVLRTLGRCDEAVAAYEQALALDAMYASAYAGMSKALLQLGRKQEAEQVHARAEQLGYEDEE